MTRRAARWALLLGVLSVATAETGFGQGAGTGDKITFRDRKNNKDVTVEGEIKDAGGGAYQIVIGKQTTPVSPADVVKVFPGDMPGLPRNDFRAADDAEGKRDFQKARDGFESLKAKATDPKAKRYVAFKTALLTARLADEGKDDPKKAADGLSAFLSENPKGWETWPVGRTLARMQLEANRADQAAATWEKLAKNDGLPRDLRDEALLNAVDAHVRGGKFDLAVVLAGEAEKTIKGGPQKDRLTILQAAAKAAAGGKYAEGAAPIMAVLSKTTDPSARATGHGMLGELFLAAEKPRDAMWEFLWVEVVHDQNTDEKLKAVWRLGTVFEQQGDKDRADQYKEKLKKLKLGA